MTLHSLRRAAGAAVVACAAAALLATATTAPTVAGPPAPAKAVGAVGAAPALAVTAASGTRPKPNIVMVMVDDMRADELRYMPWTRRLLAGQGVQFVNSFAPFPLCCPARASVLSGRYAHNHRVFSTHPPYGFTAFDDDSTLATWLQAGGYATDYIGKYLNGFGWMPEPGESEGNSLTYVPPGWSTWRASIDGGLPPGHPLDGSTYRYFDTTVSRNGKGLLNFAGRYQTRVYGEMTVDTIRRRGPKAQPYFLFVNYAAPHVGQPRENDDPGPVVRDDGGVSTFGTPARPADVKGMFDLTVRAAPGASWKDPDPTDKPAYLQRPATNAAERAALLEVARQRAESLWLVDRQVKRTIDAIQATGELRRTLVVFTSDNGYFLGEQGIRGGKTFPHDPSLRTPLLMRGPGIPAGQRRWDPVTSIDIAPTLARFAGVRPASGVDGVSVLAVARRGDEGWTRPVLTETGPMYGAVRDTDFSGQPLEEEAERDVRFAIGVRTPRYLYVDLATGERELYDMATDPRQYDNLAGDPAYAETEAALAAVLQQTRDCAGADCATGLPPELARRR